jgi:hypothetical protein
MPIGVSHRMGSSISGYLYPHFIWIEPSQLRDVISDRAADSRTESRFGIGTNVDSAHAPAATRSDIEHGQYEPDVHSPQRE